MSLHHLYINIINKLINVAVEHMDVYEPDSLHSWLLGFVQTIWWLEKFLQYVSDKL